MSSQLSVGSNERFLVIAIAKLRVIRPSEPKRTSPNPRKQGTSVGGKADAMEPGTMKRMVAFTESSSNQSYVEPSPYAWLRTRAPVPTTYAPACAPLYPFQKILENRTSRARVMLCSCTEVVERKFSICIEIWQVELESCVWRVSFHKYAYVHGDPIQGIDPTGMFLGFPVYLSLMSDSLAKGTAILGIWSTIGKQGAKWRNEGIELIANGEFEQGMDMYELGNGRIQDAANATQLATDIISFTQLAIGVTAIATNLPSIIRSLPSLFKNAREFLRSGKTILHLMGDAARSSNAPKLAHDAFLFRADSRAPSVAFNQGLGPRAGASESDVLQYASGATGNSIFVGGTKIAHIAEKFAKEKRIDHVFIVRARGQRSIDVNATLGSRSPHKNETEVLVPYGFDSEDVVGYYKILGDNRVFVPNPGFKFN